MKLISFEIMPIPRQVEPTTDRSIELSELQQLAREVAARLARLREGLG
jgi:hypothetical protein